MFTVVRKVPKGYCRMQFTARQQSNLGHTSLFTGSVRLVIGLTHSVASIVQALRRTVFFLTNRKPLSANQMSSANTHTSPKNKALYPSNLPLISLEKCKSSCRRKTCDSKLTVLSLREQAKIDSLMQNCELLITIGV